MNEVDFIIVGSGPASMASAFELSKRYKVLILEQGCFPSKEMYVPKRSVNFLYAPILPIFSNGSLFAFGQGGAFGGGSVINGALFWPLPNHIKNRWSAQFGEDFIESLDINYKFWFKELNCSYSVDDQQFDVNIDSIIMRDAARLLSWNVVTVPRLLFNCVLDNNCGFGCEGKLSLDKYFKLKLKDKVHVLTDTKVTMILKSGRRITGVKTSKGFFTAKKGVILAAGATNSYYLLRKARLVKRSYIQFHCNFKILVLHDKVIDANRGTMFTHQIQEFMDEGILFMPTNVTDKSIKTCIVNLSEEQQNYIIKNKNCVAIYVVQIQPRAVGNLRRLLGFNYAHYDLEEVDQDLIYRALNLALEWLRCAGFKEIVMPRKKSPRIDSIGECNISRELYDFISVHATSANRMSLGEVDGNTDYNGLVWGTDNLWVTDSSVLPTNLGESPQGVIMSNATRICEKI